MSVGGLVFLTKCMRYYDATFGAGMFVVSYIFSTTIMSFVRYSTFEHLRSYWQVWCYFSGLSMLLVGVWVFVMGKKTLDKFWGKVWRRLPTWLRFGTGGEARGSFSPATPERIKKERAAAGVGINTPGATAKKLLELQIPADAML